MAGWLSKLFTGSIVEIGEGVANIADRFIQSADEKAAFKLEMERLLQARDAELEATIRTELQAKERVMVAELQSGDSYTRRARPTMAYFGMAVILLNYVILPWAGFFMSGEGVPPPLDMPAEFWYAWAGVVGVWSIGRTMERRGSQQELVKIVTGKQNQPSILGD